MAKPTSDNVIEFPEYLIEQRQLDRWLTIASCSIVIGSDEPMAYVEMILDKFGHAPNQNAADVIAHERFAAKPRPDARAEPEWLRETDSAVPANVLTETVFNEWIDAWLPN